MQKPGSSGSFPVFVCDSFYAAALVIEAFVLLAETPLYGLWTGIITALIILYNFAGVWAMARVLLPKLLGRRGKALVNVIDGWIAPKKA